jgi:putative sigma-54 modulation protein
MHIELKGRNLPVTDDLREHVVRRFDNISKQVSEAAVLELEVADENVPGDPVSAEAVLRLKGTSLRAKEVSKDAKHAVILVSENMERQVKRNRDKRRGRRDSRAAAEASRNGDTAVEALPDEHPEETSPSL